jgi:hypothetical protein
MNRTALLLLLIAAPVAHADELAKVFADQGKSYIRSDQASALVVGTELPAFSDAAGAKPAGKVIVMEVTGQLARVTFDEDASRAGAKYVRVGVRAGAAQAGGQPPPPPPPPSMYPPLPPVVSSRPVALQATLGRGDNAITITNNTDAPLSGCELRFPDRRFAPVSMVPARKKVTIGYGAIKPPPDVGDEYLTMRCNEGESDFRFNEPNRSSGELKGHAENRGRGSVLIFNDSSQDWTGCDVIKPNGDHFMQNNLGAHASDSIRGGLFKAPSGAEVIQLICVEGKTSQAVP